MSGRRKIDNPGYVDLYHPYLFAFLVLIIIFSLADAYFTIDAIAGGCLEVNPIMDWALDLGVAEFVLIKLLVTGIGLMILCIHKNFPKVKWVIGIVLFGYVLLILWHLYLLQFR